MSKPRTTRTVGIDRLRDLMQRLLVAAGSSEENARVSADQFLEADLRGIPTQGLDHMPSNLERLRAGKIKGHARPRVVKDGPCFALIDGGDGPGQPAGLMAADLVAEKAKATGSAVVGITHSADIFMIAYYGERIARAGCAGIVASDAMPQVRPYGGLEGLLGTNPYVMAVPTAGEHPIVLDIATSAISASHVRVAAYHDEEVPTADGRDAEGNPTVKASEVKTLGPLAGYKGFGLGLCVALVSAPLIGSAVGRAHAEWFDADGAPTSKGHFFLAIDPGAFGNPEVFRNAVSEYVAEIKATRRAPGVDELLVPGERAFRERARNLERGAVDIFDEAWIRIAKIADELGVSMPDGGADSGSEP